MVDLALGSAGAPAPLPKPSVLIIDQDDATRAATIAALKGITPEAKILEATSIKEAMPKTKNQKFDLLIADTRVEPLAGNGVISFIAKIAPENMPGGIYVISATVDDFELMTDLPTAVLHGFPLQPKVLEKNFRELFKIPEPPKPKPQAAKGGFDIEFVNPFLTATLDIVKVFAKTDSKREGLYVKQPGQPSGDISGVMVIDSDTYKGSFSVSFQESCFCAIASTMLAKTVTGIDEKNQDVASEICNQIMGIAKKPLNDLGHVIRQKVPSVTVGRGHSVKHDAAGACVAVTFSTDSGKFQIEVVLVPVG